jgi:subtilase family serine protease
MMWLAGRAARRRACAWLLACVTTATVAACSQAPAPGPAHSVNPTASATIGTTPELAPGSPSKSEQIRQLTSALAKLQKIQGPALGGADINDYQISQLWRLGIDGAGTTVAVIEGWNDPAIGQEVRTFDLALGLPDPQITTIYPVGLPKKCPAGMVKLGSYGSCQAWGGELTLDVLAAHLIAPYARILIVVAPADSEITDDAASQVAPPEMMKAAEYVASHDLANVISISDGTGESSYSHGIPEILAQDPGELAAAAAGIPLLVGTGDCGVVQNLPVASGQCLDTTSFPDSAVWDDSPWVTAVGGAIPNLTAKGRRVGPDKLWGSGTFGSGAGLSKVFRRPAYQDRVNSSAMRSVPDLVMDSRDGTSEATPLLAGVLALATQLNGANVGPINPALYAVLGPRGTKAGIVDVTSGSNSSMLPGGNVVSGFSAAPGFDVASGWGTINAALFVPSLVAATRAEGNEATARAQARAALLGLEHGIVVSGSQLTAGGFLPGHPVRLRIDGRLVTTLTADARGRVSYRLQPAAGLHSIRLTSMLLTQTGSFSGG